MGELPSIHQLECFIIYGRVRNFSLAAQEANITQSAFSVQMKKLEEAVLRSSFTTGIVRASTPFDVAI